MQYSSHSDEFIPQLRPVFEMPYVAVLARDAEGTLMFLARGNRNVTNPQAAVWTLFEGTVPDTGKLDFLRAPPHGPTVGGIELKKLSQSLGQDFKRPEFAQFFPKGSSGNFGLLISALPNKKELNIGLIGFGERLSRARRRSTHPFAIAEWSSSSHADTLLAPQFEYSNVSEERRERLLKTHTPDQALDRIIDNYISVTDLTIEATDNNTFKRFVCTVQVKGPGFDAFFNSPGGLRGQYYCEAHMLGLTRPIQEVLMAYSPGRAFELELARRISKKAYAEIEAFKKKSPDGIIVDLSLSGAKANMKLPDDRPDHRDPLFPPNGGVISPSYVSEFKPYLSMLLEIRPDIVREFSELGRHIPERTRFVIKGAWIPGVVTNKKPPQKPTRSGQLGLLGFT